MAETFGLKIGLEGEKEFKNQLAEINQSFKVLGSEMKLVDSQFDKNDQSVEALTARNNILAKSIETQKSKISVLQDALKNASASFGENDKRTQAWQIQLNNAQAELNKLEKELDDNNSTLGDTSKEMDKAAKSADKFGDEVKESGEQADDSSEKFEGLGSVCKGVTVALAAAFAAVSAAAIKAAKSLVNMTTEGAAYADTVLTESTVTGIATDKLQEYMYAAELVDVSVDTLTKSMAKNISSMKSAAAGSSSFADAYAKLGISVTDADGNLRDSDEVYWELIDALGKIENETERDALAMTLLGKSAQELNPLITAGADKMKELGEQAQASGYVLSDDLLGAYGALDDQIQYLNNGCTAAKNALGTVLLPILTDLAGEGVSLLSEFTNAIKDCGGDLDGVAQVFGDILPKVLNVVMQYIPTILKMLGSFVASLGQAIIDNIDYIVDAVSEIILTISSTLTSGLPKIADGALKLVLTLTNGILDNLDAILEAAVQVVVTIVDGIAKAMPTLIPKIVEVVAVLAKTLLDNLPLILKAALELIKGLAKGILDAIPILIKSLPAIVKGIVEFILGAIPEIIDAGIQLLTSLVGALPDIIAAIVEVIPQIIDGIINAVVEALPLIIDAGIQLFISLVQALPTIITTICNAIPTIISSICNAFIGNIDKIISCGVQLLTSLITNLPVIIAEIVKAIPQIIQGIVGAFSNGISQMVEVGKNLVRGLWEGIQSLASWIWDKVSNWAKGLWDGICDFFGIHSPSRKMAFVGDMLMRGLAKGIDENANDVIHSAKVMTRDLNDAFRDVSADFSSVPATVNVTKTVDEARTNIIPQSGNGGFFLQLAIENFNNYTNQDIADLTNEIMETADNFVKRREVVFG